MTRQHCTRCGREFETAVSFRGSVCIECGSGVTAPVDEDAEPTSPIAKPRGWPREVMRSAQILGEITIRDHCKFRWVEPVGPGARVYELEDHHCEQCISILRKRGVAIRSALSPARP